MKIYLLVSVRYADVTHEVCRLGDNVDRSS